MISYYSDTLYPLQNKVLGLVASLNTPFYLTGGTALSRAHLNHRYSDDLDFFVNNDSDFAKHAELVLQELKRQFQVDIKLRSQDYYSLTIDDILKVELVNDVSFHDNGFISTDFFGKVDNINNILSNKLSAIIGRDEPKDYVDIWAITKDRQIQWKHIFTSANSKAVGIFPPDVARKLTVFDTSLLKLIKWVDGVEPSDTQFRCDIDAITTKMLSI
jgi:predicted nucleotidyltransferase component of viral defense system